MLKEKCDNYELHRAGKAEYLTFPAFDKYENLKHVFTTRLGGVSSGECENWNFGNHGADSEENILKNFRILADVLGVSEKSMVVTQQTHTKNIRIVTREDMGKGVTRKRDYKDIDGLITCEKNIPIITTHADCNSIFFYDRKKQVIGLAHSGWKGTLQHIGIEMIEKMEEVYGTNPLDLIAGIGPALCQDCFEVDEDVAEMFFMENPAYRMFSYEKGNKYYIDLKKIIKMDLICSDMSADNIYDMELCTKCNNDKFFSHRGQGRGRGLMVSAIMLK